MPKTLILLLALLAVPVRAADPWTKTEVALEAAYLAALVVDYEQSTHSPGRHELNPLLPRDPSRAVFNVACIGSAVGHVMISNFLGHKGRRIWQGTTLALELNAVRGNYHAGIRLRW